VDCYIVHPSDLAVALISLKAEATIAGSNGDRTLPLEEFFIGPERDIMAETVLQPGEFLSMVSVPRVGVGHRSIYLKARERQAQDFALASVAVAIEVADGSVHDVRITLGGVAPTPYRAIHAEDAMRGKAVESIDARVVGELSVRDSQPLRDNHFKVRLAASLVSRAIKTLLESENSE
ncbi:MAG: FAD binding domain-containing protein, partial [Chloroflexi bacterium]|nr:FAD binding domain-containing protein [Chloroflexota bacterium]